MPGAPSRAWSSARIHTCTDVRTGHLRRAHRSSLRRPDHNNNYPIARRKPLSKVAILVKISVPPVFSNATPLFFWIPRSFSAPTNAASEVSEYIFFSLARNLTPVNGFSPLEAKLYSAYRINTRLDLTGERTMRARRQRSSPFSVVAFVSRGESSTRRFSPTAILNHRIAALSAPRLRAR